MKLWGTKRPYPVAQSVRFSSPPGVITSGQRVIYIATTGDNNNVGSIDSPKASIDHYGSPDFPGVIYMIRGGTYSQTASWRINSGGTRDYPVTVMAYPGETVIIDGTNLNADQFIIGGGISLVLGSRITFRNSKGQGVSIYGSGIISRVQDLTISDAWQAGILVYDSMSGGVSRCEVEIVGNHIIRPVSSNRTGVQNWGQGLSIVHCDRAYVAYNVIRKAYGEALDFISCKNPIACFNTIIDGYSVGIYLDNTQYARIFGNYCYTTGDKENWRTNRRYDATLGYWIGDTPMTGVTMGREHVLDSRYLECRGNVIEDNVFRDTKSGVSIVQFDDSIDVGNISSSPFDCIIRRNRTYSNWNLFYSLYLYFPSRVGDPYFQAPSGNVIEDNVWVATNGGNQTPVTLPAGFTLRQNAWSGGVVTAAFRTSDDTVMNAVPSIPSDPSGPTTEYPDLPNSG